MTGRRVGRSYRTPGKHALLNKMVGAYTGVYVAGAPHLFADPFTLVDLCAGDGRAALDDDAATDESSPVILYRHVQHARSCGRRAELVLIELRANHYESLAGVSGDWDDIHLIHGDARTPGIVPRFWNDKSPVFVNNDPNHVHDFALSDDLVQSLPYYTTTLSTLGCNVGGLKQMPRDERLKWYDHVERVTALTHRRGSNQEATLFMLDGDASYWAYLITAPTVWRGRVLQWIGAATRAHGPGVTIAHRADTEHWDALLDKLFLRKSERDDS